jgi:hypothetical protein
MNNKKTKKIKSYLVSLFFSWINRGFIVAFWTMIFPHLLLPKSIKVKGELIKHIIIKEYIFKKYIDVIHMFTNRKEISFREKPAPPFPVWVCWWQGHDNMPEIIKMCYQSLLDASNGHPVNLITLDNYKNYVTIPDFILEKFNDGIISFTLLSDILRIFLLYEHGGLWVDSTVFVTSSLPQYYDYELFSVKRELGGLNVSKRRLVGYLIYANKSNILFKFLQTIFIEYFSKEHRIIDYFLMLYFIITAYENIPTITNMIDAIPLSNSKIEDMENKLNTVYTPDAFQELCRDTQFHKLSWKKHFEKYTGSGELTLYGYLLQNYYGQQ